jgi:putative transposase
MSDRWATRELTVLIERKGRPGMIISDNGTAFTSHAIFAWAKHPRIARHNIVPGNLMLIGYVESVSGKIRDELLRETLFLSLDQAREARRGSKTKRLRGPTRRSPRKRPQHSERS